MKINNRRYIGNKSKLLDFIYKSINDLGYTNNSVFLDMFAGTGVVANYFANKGYKTIVNDNLYSNALIYKAFLGVGRINIKKVGNFIDKYNSVKPEELEENYFSKVYAHKYFSANDAKIIGYIRDNIEENKEHLTKREYAYLISSLIYSTDKIANTVGHFESYLRQEPADKGVKLEKLEINTDITPASIYNEDSNRLAKKIKADITYIDPPYNARQYVNFYHVLENLARWNKPTDFEGNSMKFKRDELKSGYCRKNTAKKLFEDLINSLNTKLIVVSYNNTYEAKSSSSNNTLLPDEILSILNKKGVTTIKEKDYKTFNAGKTDLKGHKEILYICEVFNENN